MFAPSDIDGHDALEHPARALDRVDAHPRRAAVRGLAAHGDDDVDAALVGERDPAGGADHDHGEAWRETDCVADADRGVVPAGLSSGAHREHETAAQGEAIGGSLHRRKRRGERPFLLGHAAAPDMGARRILDQLAGIGIGHAVRRMGHGIGHQHQALVGTLRPEFDQEIAHRIAPPWQAERLHQRHHLLGDEALHLRFVLEAFGLGTGMADEGTRPRDDVFCRDAQMSGLFVRHPWLLCRKRLSPRRRARAILTASPEARPAEDQARRGPRTIPPWRPAPRARSGRACAHRARAASIRHRNAGSRSYAGRARR